MIDLDRDEAIVIGTPRMVMRNLVEDDEPLYCVLFTDAGTMQFVGAPWSQERAAQNFRKTLDSIRRRPMERVVLAVLDRAAHSAIGICTLQRFDPSRGSAELGIMLAPGSRAGGLGNEAVVGLVSWAFATLSFDEISVQFAAKNSAPRRIVVGLGFSRRDDDTASPGGPVLETWFVRRESWWERQPVEVKPMSDLIGFLERMGQDAHLRHAADDQLEQTLIAEQIDAEGRAALLSQDLEQLRVLLDAPPSACCLIEDPD